MTRGLAFYIAASLALGKAKALEYKERGAPKKGKPSLWLPIAIKTTGRDRKTIERWVREAAKPEAADARREAQDVRNKALQNAGALVRRNPVRGYVTVPEKTIPTPFGDGIRARGNSNCDSNCCVAPKFALVVIPRQQGPAKSDRVFDRCPASCRSLR